MITLDVLPALIIGVIALLLLVSTTPAARACRAGPRAQASRGRTAAGACIRNTSPSPACFILRLQTPVLYSNAAPLAHRIKQLVGEADPTPRAVISRIRRDRPPRHHQRGDAAAQLVGELRVAGIDLALADVHMPVVRMARRAGLLDELGEDRIFRTVERGGRGAQPLDVRKPGRSSAPPTSGAGTRTASVAGNG